MFNLAVKLIDERKSVSSVEGVLIKVNVLSKYNVFLMQGLSENKNEDVICIDEAISVFDSSKFSIVVRKYSDKKNGKHDDCRDVSEMNIINLVNYISNLIH